MSRRERARRGGGKSKIVLTVILLLAVCAAAFYYKDVIITPVKNILFGKNSAAELSFSGYTGSAYGSFNDSLAVVSGKKIQVISLENKTLLDTAADISTPAIDTKGEYAVVFDIGGQSAKVLGNGGIKYEIAAEHPIISASVNEKGYSAVCSQEDGYNGVVSVYDSEGKVIFQWFSGEAFIISAKISPNSKTVAVLAAAADGGRIVFFTVGSESEKGRFMAAGDVLVDMEFSGNKTVVAVSKKGVYTVGTDGGGKKEYIFKNEFLRGYAINDSGICYAVLSPYQVGGECRAVAIKGSREVGKVENLSEVSDIACEKGKFAVLLNGKIEVYSKYGKLKSSFENVSGVSEILLCSGKVLAIKSYSAEAL